MLQVTPGSSLRLTSAFCGGCTCHPGSPADMCVAMSCVPIIHQQCLPAADPPCSGRQPSLHSSPLLFFLCCVNCSAEHGTIKQRQGAAASKESKEFQETNKDTWLESWCQLPHRPIPSLSASIVQATRWSLDCWDGTAVSGGLDRRVLRGQDACQDH